MINNNNFIVPTAENILARYFPKYVTLRAMTNEMINHLTIDPNSVYTINVYVDIYRMLLSIYHREKVTVRNYTEITSSIINFCAHIRSFYRDKYKVHTRIFLIYNNYLETGVNLWQSNFIRGYNLDAETSIKRHTVIRNIIMNNLPVIKLLCEHIEDVYFVDRPVESMITIYDLINKEQDPNIPHVIFTNCPLTIQVPVFAKNTFIFRLIKLWEKNESGEAVPVDYFTVIGRHNAIMEFTSNSRNFMVAEKLIPMINVINPELISLFITLAGAKRKEKNITKLMNINKLCKIMSDAVLENPTLNRYNEDITDIYNAMKLYKLIKEVDLTLLKYRYKAIDLISNYLRPKEAHDCEC